MTPAQRALSTIKHCPSASSVIPGRAGKSWQEAVGKQKLRTRHPLLTENCKPGLTLLAIF
jgi:hypothetical protein